MSLKISTPITVQGFFHKENRGVKDYLFLKCWIFVHRYNQINSTQIQLDLLLLIWFKV